jgi:hypothetical protein
MKIERIYHHYDRWEDYKAGFYSDYSKSELNDLNEAVRYVFSSAKHTEKYMSLVILHWVNSTEHNLTNISMNRVAWLGQAACCFYGGVPSKATMFLWKLLDEKTQRRSDKVAQKLISEWGYEGGIPDEAPLELERIGIAPSYRQICVALMKNPNNLESLGYQREKCRIYQEIKREEIYNREYIGKQLKLFL